MLFGFVFDIVFYIASSVVYYSNVSFSRLITEVGFSAILYFLSPNSGCLGKAALFYCGTPWAFHVIILNCSSRTHLRTKVTPDFHLTYSKNGGNLGSESK